MKILLKKKKNDQFQFVDLKQNTVPYIAVMRFGAWLLIFLRKEQYRMKLVLAEKPSVAMSLSKVIGANQRGDGYMEGNGYLVSTDYLLMGSEPSKEEVKNDLLSIISELSTIAKKIRRYGVRKG